MWSSIFCVAGAPDDHVYTISLSRDSTLKEVFDSGLRPLNVSGLERMTCSVANKHISIVLPNDIHFEILSRITNFNVNGNNELTRVELLGAKSLTPDEGYEAMLRFSNLLRKPEAPLKGFIDRVRLNPVASDEGYWIASPSGEMPRLSVGLDTTFDREKPMSLNVIIQWNRSRADSPLRREQITPPPGYESFSMSPLPNAPALPALPLATGSRAAHNQVLTNPQKSSPPTALATSTPSADQQGASKSRRWPIDRFEHTDHFWVNRHIYD